MSESECRASFLLGFAADWAYEWALLRYGGKGGKEETLSRSRSGDVEIHYAKDETGRAFNNGCIYFHNSCQVYQSSVRTLVRTGSLSFVYLRAKNRNHHIRMVTYGSSLLAAFSGVAGRLPRGFLTLPPRFTFQADLSPRHAVT